MTYTIGGTDVQTANIHLDVVDSIFAPAEVEGEDDIVPEAEGKEPGVWIARRRLFRAEGHVQGTGSTELAQQQSWNTATFALMDLLDRTAFREHVIGPPDQGLTDEWSITARCLNFMGGPILNAWTFQKWSIVFESIDPDWLPVESS